MTYRQLAKELAGDEWTLGDQNRISTEDFLTWAKTNNMGYDRNDYLARAR